MPKFTKKRVVAIVAVSMLAIGGGAAYAYWTTSGTGTGNATNATQNGTLVLHASFANGLTPGATETVTYTADNSNSSSLYIGTITPTVSIDAAHAATCDAADFTLAPTDSHTTVPANSATVAAGTGSLHFADTGLNQDGCKGATVTLTLASN